MATVPTVYFIDDSATMREVIKIAFRRENINVLTSHDAVLALEEIEKNRPDIVITDVIMPVKDGYEVCQFIKTHPELSKIPVVLMSGVVNRAVAERAFAVKANELLRKPFQPQDLIARVRHLLMSKGASRTSPAAAANASAALNSIFSTTGPMAPRSIAAAAKEPAMAMSAGASIAMLESSLSEKVPAPAMSMAPAFSVVVPDVDPLLEVPNPPAKPAMAISAIANPFAPVAPGTEAVFAQTAPPVNGTTVNGRTKSALGELNRPRIEIMRLEGLVKKLQAELQAEREYSKALEAHIKTLQESER
jgi:twitching motility two-component system response regulator PilH